MREIPLSEFLEDYGKRLLFEIVPIESLKKIFALSVKGQAENPQLYEVVWAALP